MSEVWSEVRLADVATWGGGLTPSKGRADFWERGTIPWISSKEVVGGVLESTEHTVTELALNETALRLTPAGAVAIVVRSGILAHTLPVAYVPFPTTVNQDVKIGVASPGVDGRFLRYTLESQSSVILARFRKTGTTVQSINFPALLQHAIAVPSVETQRRIVDLMGAIDTQIGSVAAEHQSARALLETYLDAWHAGLAGTGLDGRLGDLMAFRSGPSWAAADESEERGPGSLRVVKITNTRPGGALDMSDHTYVRGLGTSVAVLDESSLIVIRTNGNRGRIGNVYRPTTEAMGCAVSAFQFTGKAQDRDIRDAVYWWLRSPAEQAAMSDAASGSTGLGNLAAGWLKARPIPDLAGQDVGDFEAADRLIAALDAEAAALRTLRRVLLAGLLNREVEIPEAYDLLLLDAGVA